MAISSLFQAVSPTSFPSPLSFFLSHVFIGAMPSFTTDSSFPELGLRKSTLFLGRQINL